MIDIIQSQLNMIEESWQETYIFKCLKCINFWVYVSIFSMTRDNAVLHKLAAVRRLGV